VEHVGICYGKIQRFLNDAGIQLLHFFAPIDASTAGSDVKAIAVSSLRDFSLMVDSLE
jgi:hypothetical protein